jgi:hypothetical protein
LKFPGALTFLAGFPLALGLSGQTSVLKFGGASGEFVEGHRRFGFRFAVAFPANVGAALPIPSIIGNTARINASVSLSRCGPSRAFIRSA